MNRRSVNEDIEEIGCLEKSDPARSDWLASESMISINRSGALETLQAVRRKDL